MTVPSNYENAVLCYGRVRWEVTQSPTWEEVESLSRQPRPGVDTFFLLFSRENLEQPQQPSTTTTILLAVLPTSRNCSFELASEIDTCMYNDTFG